MFRAVQMQKGPMPHRPPNPVLSSRFDRALVYASNKHREQSRKSSDVPYIAHLLAVASTVLEAGADEDTAIGALLHDVAEDQGGAALLPEIEKQFGSKVREIVASCSDSLRSKDEPKQEWRVRKETYLAALPLHSPEARLVSLADKLHNARSIVRDLKVMGLQAFERFQGKQAGTLWYYSELLHHFKDMKPEFLFSEFAASVAEMSSLSQPNREELHA
jgi:(p)ppGpp synthase/HD superfamily hydrolase